MDKAKYVRVIALCFATLMTIPQIAAAQDEYIVIENQPVKSLSSYIHGEELDLSGLELTVMDEYDSPIASNIGINDITVEIDDIPINIDETLTHEDHNGKDITVIYNNSIKKNIGTLTVGKKQAVFGTPSAINTTYAQGLTLDDIVLASGYSFTGNLATPLEAGDGQDFPAKYNPDPNNYYDDVGNITINVNKAKIANVVIVDIVEPTIGETPKTTVTGTGNYTVSPVTWLPNETFKASKQYTATVTLTADASYEFANSVTATINGYTANANPPTNNNTTITISRIFETPAATVTEIKIKSQPTNLTYTHGDALNLSGLEATLIYNDATTENIALANFASKNIATNPANGTELSASSHNNTSIEVIYNNSPTILTNTNILTVNKAKIATAEITVITPITDGIPNQQAIVAANSNFTGTVAWLPNDNPFQGGVSYTAAATLTTNDNYEFAVNFANATINGENATVSNNTGETVTISYSFPQTQIIRVTGIAIKSEPANLTYAHGDVLDLSGLEVTLTYSDGTTEDVALAGFTSKSITTNPANGAALVASTHGNAPIAVIFNSSSTIRANTKALTVSKIEIATAAIAITAPEKDRVPSTVATGTGNFTISIVSWSPNHNIFQSDNQYIATVTLTAKDNYAFTTKTIATLNEDTLITMVGKNGATLTLTHIFPKISDSYIVLNINGLTLDEPKNNNFIYASPCEEDYASINIDTKDAEEATIIIDGENTNSHDVKLSYGNNKVSITAITPNSTQEYELTINKPLPTASMIKVRWNNTLTVINNAKYNDYEFEGYKWYRNGREIGTGQSWSAGSSGEKLKSEDKYHVEATTKDGETIRSCEIALPEEKQEYGILLKRNSENSVEFEVITPEKSEIEIAIYDIAGNLISKPTGNSIGSEVVSGLYFVVAKAKGESGEVYRYSAKLAVRK